MTNSPGYDWHLLNLRNYANLSPQAARPREIDGVSLALSARGSGMLGLPGDFTPPSRFERAVAFVNTMIPAKDAADAVNAASVMLNNFDIPKGLCAKAAPRIPSRLYAMVRHRRHEPQGLLLLDDVRPQNAFGRSLETGLRGQGHFLFPLDKVRTEDIQDRSADFPTDPERSSGAVGCHARESRHPDVRRRDSRCAGMTRCADLFAAARIGPAPFACTIAASPSPGSLPPVTGKVSAWPRHLPKRTISRTTSL